MTASPGVRAGNLWVLGARPRTLPAAVVPVVVGTALVVGRSGFDDVVPWRALAALVTAVFIQVGTNYANDYHDGIRGTDDVRVGPVRLVGQGLKPPRQVLVAAVVAFGVAAVAGLALAAATTWWVLAVGAACFAAGWLYTGGPRPYGYHGLGEVFVFVFFGLVATAGSAFVHLERVPVSAVIAAIPVGFLATALLVVNNLRDIPTDARSGKQTLAVRLGDESTRRLYVALMSAAVLLAAISSLPASLLVLGAAPFAWRAMQAVEHGAAGPALVGVLQDTGRTQLVFGALYALGLALS